MRMSTLWTLALSLCSLSLIWSIYAILKRMPRTPETPRHFLLSQYSRQFAVSDNETVINGNLSSSTELHDGIFRVMDALPGFNSSVECDAIFDGDTESATKWIFDAEAYWYQQVSAEPQHICRNIREAFAFPRMPLSEEEAQFPLAFGLLVYKDAIQVYFMLSAVYQPQNTYCIAVDGKAAVEFKGRMRLLGECFPNVYVMEVADVSWGGFSVVEGVFSCLRYLSDLKHPWKYYQYTSGFDMPLKTNLEMVRIFKQLNGTISAEVKPIQLSKAALEMLQPPLTLWKSSMSAVVSRQTIDFMVQNQKVMALLEFLKTFGVPDEKLWVTVAGNPAGLKVPGGFNASLLWEKIVADQEKHQVNTDAKAPSTPEEPFSLQNYWIGRHQIWGPDDGKCKGIMVRNSCVFGVGDLPDLLTSPQMVAHKFYLDYQPAAFFCLYERIRLRALDPSQKLFKGSVYSQLPQVLLSKGVNISDIRTVFE